MRTTSDWIRAAQSHAGLVEIDMRDLIHHHGRSAFWIARERQKGREPDLGRGPTHWQRVGELILQRYGWFGQQTTGRWTLPTEH